MSQPLAKEPVPLSTDEHGVIRVGGSRVPIDTVLSAYRRGDTPEQIAQDYSVLQLADIYAVIAYYLKHREKVDAYLEKRHRQVAAVREEFEKRFPSEGLKERLRDRLR